MRKVVISDTSALIFFDKINELNILRSLFDTVVITPEIQKEYGESLPEWVEVSSCSNKNYQTLINSDLDPGESSAIALAVEIGDCTILHDDLKARKYARKIGLRVTGSLGVLIKARQQGGIPRVQPILEKVKLTNFRMSQDLEAEILRICQEI